MHIGYLAVLVRCIWRLQIRDDGADPECATDQYLAT